ncbi:MAG: DMT family transporter [Gammaproteobacteria bacterium]
MKMNLVENPIFCVVLASFLLAITTLTGKSTLPIVVLVFMRFLIPAIIMMIKQHKNNLHAIKNITSVTLIRVCFVVLSQYSLFYAIKNTTILNANALLNTAPIFVVVIDMLMTKDISVSKIIGVIIGFVGVCFCVKPNIHHLNLAILIGLAAGFCWAMSNILQNVLVKRMSSLDCAHHYYVIGSVITFIVLWLSGNMNELAVILNWQQMLIIMTFTISTIGFQLLVGKAYQYRTAASLSGYLYLTVFFGAVLGWIFFNEVPDILSVAGAALIFAGIIMTSYFDKKRLMQIEKVATM